MLTPESHEISALADSSPNLAGRTASALEPGSERPPLALADGSKSPRDVQVDFSDHGSPHEDDTSTVLSLQRPSAHPASAAGSTTKQVCDEGLARANQALLSEITRTLTTTPDANLSTILQGYLGRVSRPLHEG